MADIFVSYKREDRDKVRPLVEALQSRGWSVWWDIQIGPGQTWDQVIEDELNAAKCIVVVWSERSIGSDPVRTEAHEGRQRKCLIPVTIEGVAPPKIFGLIQATDLTEWDGGWEDASIQRVFAGVARLVNPTARGADAGDASKATPVPGGALQSDPSRTGKGGAASRSLTSMSIGGILTVPVVAALLWMQWPQLSALLPQVPVDYTLAPVQPPTETKSIDLEQTDCLVGRPADTAVQACTEFLTRYPTHPAAATALFRRGLAKERSDQIDGAITDYSKAVEMAPGFALAYGSLGNLKRKKGNLDNAIADLTKAIELDPQLASAYNARGLAYRRKGDNEKAIAEYGRALEINPEYAEAYSNRGYVYSSKGEWDRAIGDFNRAIKADGTFVEAYEGLGFAFYETHQHEQAIAAFSEAIRLNPKSARGYRGRALVSLDRGVARDDMRDFDNAIVDYTAAIQLDPSNAINHRDRAIVYRRKGDFDRAIEDFTSAIAKNAANPDIYNMRGYTYTLRQKAGDRELAEKDFRKAIEIKPNHEGAKSNLRDLLAKP